MAQITYLQAIRQALTEEMERDPTTFILGEDVALSAFGSTRGLFERFGAERVRDTPISEAGFVGAAVGAAMAGMRPICEIEIAPFIYCAFDQIVNQAAKLRYMSGGQARLPITFRTLYGAAGGAAAQHSETVYPHLLPVPGLKIVAPSGPADMLGLLKTAIRDDNPVVVFEHAALGRSREEVPDGSDFLVPIGKATVKREGKDVTLVAIGAMVPRAMAVANRLAKENIEVEVVDPRTLAPLDEEALLTSLGKTNRMVIVDEAHLHGSAASEIAATMVEKGFDMLDAPIRRVAALDVPIPFSKPLEAAVIPDERRIEAAIRAVLG
ncbi:MAG TPA: pyruvate dehydrogenase complex E1 component subunit beta [Candidatus Binataceae bacterium]|jgi:pyruvate dehydrogenase E1 component beta subunit|nr:pyruvate dehydrogenase complex E1 component subunit beta [Candidatus Binataceae bacterium]